MRLIAAGGGAPQHRFYHAGIEIQLDQGALTYWRTPGGAGVPPEFSFEGSANTADVSVFYPAPHRIDEDGTDVFGYRDHVIFPLHVTPKDPARPVLLDVTLSYAVCAGICLPAKAEAKLTLDPNGQDGAGAETAIIAIAEANVPKRLTPQQRDAMVMIERLQSEPNPTWRLSPKDPSQNAFLDIFAEAPPGWDFETRKSEGAGEFIIVSAGEPQRDSPLPPGSSKTVPVVLTLKSERQAYEFAVDLDTASAH